MKYLYLCKTFTEQKITGTHLNNYNLASVQTYMHTIEIHIQIRFDYALLINFLVDIEVLFVYLSWNVLKLFVFISCGNVKC